jgi:hypothetical protein
LLSVSVNDPENDERLRDLPRHRPGPEESVALPVHVPFRLAGEDGSVGVEPLPQPAVAAASTIAVITQA